MAQVQHIPRVDGLGKLAGRTRYVDDLVIPGVLHGGTVRSQLPRGRIKAIRFDPAIPWHEYTILDHRDIPGRNEVLFIECEQPILAAGEVRHRLEPILLLAHRSVRALWRGLRGIQVDIDPLPAVESMFQPLTPELIQYGSDNIFKRIHISKGDAAGALASATRVIEGIYHTGSQEHVYLETQGMIAQREGARLVVQGSMQCPYYVLNSLKHCFRRADEAFRVLQTPTGGGFGGKEDYPSIIALHAALLAEKSGAPVKVVYDRQEDMSATTKRHPSRVRHRTGLDSAGRIIAMDIEVLLDGGAYVTLSPVVLSRGVIHAAGPYYCENVNIHGEARLSNAPPYGAFRGFGAPQTLFALERHMDVIAKSINIDPVELRRRNLIRDGQSTSTGQVICDGVDRVALQHRALELAQYSDKCRTHAEFNAASQTQRRGVGVATFQHGAGFTGSGETKLASEVWVEGLPDGRVEVLTANTDMGQGTETILTQIAAERLAVAAHLVVLSLPDTARVPNSGPTVASRTAMVVGRLIERACDDLLNQTDPNGDHAAADRDLRSMICAWHQVHPGQRLIGRATYTKPASTEWDDAAYRGDAYACFAWATYVAEVEVDLRTGNVRVLDFVAVQEVGRVLHPTLARGQIAGGVVQGIGWALMEEVVLEGGAMKNSQLTNYIIPVSGDLPPIRVCFVESPSPFGPGGAKGIGELPMDGPAPAIVNAVSRALGMPFDAIPLTPERILEALEATAIGSN